jgi:hypothetical protein
MATTAVLVVVAPTSVAAGSGRNAVERVLIASNAIESSNIRNATASRKQGTPGVKITVFRPRSFTTGSRPLLPTPGGGTTVSVPLGVLKQPAGAFQWFQVTAEQVAPTTCTAPAGYRVPVVGISVTARGARGPLYSDFESQETDQDSGFVLGQPFSWPTRVVPSAEPVADRRRSRRLSFEVWHNCEEGKQASFSFKKVVVRVLTVG